MRVLILGNGAIGSQMAAVLHQQDFTTHVDVADPNCPDLPMHVDVLTRPYLVADYDYVINTAPIHVPRLLTGLLIACIQHKTHYLDTNEDIRIGQYVKDIGETQHKVLFAPHCGIAPGMINIIGGSWVRDYDVYELDLRVGALTRFVDNKFHYTPTWSPDGLINQYLNDFETVEWGRPVKYRSVLYPDEHHNFDRFYHKFSIDGIEYECFPTSGGLGTMSQMDKPPYIMRYRTIRLPGHAFELTSLIEKSAGNREVMVSEVGKHRVHRADDLVYVVAVAHGAGDNYRSMVLRADARKPYMGQRMTAIQKCTIGGALAVLGMHRNDRLPSGFLHQHEVDWSEYRQSPFVSAIEFEESY